MINELRCFTFVVIDTNIIFLSIKTEMLIVAKYKRNL